MKKAILRNIAIVSAIFIATFSIMLTTNYFQVRGTSPLQTEVMETLKEINDRNADNPVLQEQIRRLDLLSRRAYFVQMNHLMTGVYILLGALVIFVICTRIYFVNDKDIPDKNIDPIDEWAIKTNARKYVVWIMTGIAACALIFVVLSSPYLKQSRIEKSGMISNQNTDDDLISGTVNVSATTDTESAAEVGGIPVDETNEANEASDTDETKIAEETVGSKATHNAFRGNNSTGISSATKLPVEWDLNNGKNITWKRDIPRKGYNSPVINGNKVFFSGADEEACELFCYDLTTGEQLWSLAAVNIPGSPSELPDVTEETGLAASSVTTNGNMVCAIFATGDIICADMNGKQVWAKNLGVPELNYGYASSLLIHENTVIVQFDDRKSPRVMALDLATGTERWNKSRDEKIGNWSSPIIANINNTPQLILMGNPNIRAYNPDNGELLWSVSCMSGEICTSPCSADGIVFGANEYAKAVAINAVDGSILWESRDFLPEIASPVATKDNFYVATVYGVVAAYNAKTGELRKEHELAGMDFQSSPIIADGKIYLVGHNGKVFIFSTDNDFDLLHSFETGENTFATPAFTDGKIVIKTEKSIYCVEEK